MHIPLATYRIQFTPSFGFRDTGDILNYLKDLGISDLYASPIFKAKRGSSHGYDITDPNLLNDELGSNEDFEELHSKLKGAGLFWLQDIVPNHMAFSDENKMLMDVIENGQKSSYYRFFDIKWDHPYEVMKGRVLVPFLGKFYAESLESGEIKLTYDRDGLAVKYYDLRLPINTDSYEAVLLNNISTLEQSLGGNDPTLINYMGFVHSLKKSMVQNGGEPGFDQKDHAKKMLWDLYEQNDAVKRFIDSNLSRYNSSKDAIARKRLDDLLSGQAYRLSFWKVASEEINYRRFFSINTLISLRMEDKEVFDKTHDLIFKLIRDEKFSGLRIDHIDGLYDPGSYLKWIKENSGDTYITIEKIVAPGEDLPSIWPVGSTTGYDFLNQMNGVFVAKDKAGMMSKIYYKFTGMIVPFEDLVNEKKKLIIGKHMAGDIDNLAHMIKSLSSEDMYGRDITLYGLKRALVEVMAHFPVYRTYINANDHSERDREYIECAINKAKEMAPGLVYEINFIKKFLSPGEPGLSDAEIDARLSFIMRFQQYTGPLMAKGLEDTVLYVYNRLISLNDVGGSPEKYGLSTKEFHDFNQRRVDLLRYTMNATSTHDTKRGEDVRARINVLSEIPQEWGKRIALWSRLNRNRKKIIRGKYAPDRNDEYSIYQTLLGTYPFEDSGIESYIQRMKDYIVKAIREAKVHTAWIQPDTEYEAACQSFMGAILKPSCANRFLEDFLGFQKKVAYFGIFNSLSQTLLKIASPGLPDFYQGTELWDLNLVDPDNRRGVDFKKRQSYMEDIIKGSSEDRIRFVRDLLNGKEDGRIKLFLISELLKTRRLYREVFEKGEYVPIQADGRYKDNLLAFARHYNGAFCIAIVPRFLTPLIKLGEYPFGRSVWEDTRIILPDNYPANWQNQVTKERLAGKGSLFAGDALSNFPLAMLFNSPCEQNS